MFWLSDCEPSFLAGCWTHYLHAMGLFQPGNASILMEAGCFCSFNGVQLGGSLHRRTDRGSVRCCTNIT